jgi:opacity protein-like surface antigen
VPILANFVYKFVNDSAWTPYVGVGVGANIGIFEGHTPGSDFSDTSVSFAFQGEAGVKYALSENASVGIAYKFLGTTEQSYNLAISPYFIDHASFDGNYIHGIFANFTWNF